MNTPATMGAATVTGRGHAVALPILHYWREPEMPPQDSIIYRLLREAVHDIAVLDERGWPAAIAGDAAEAVSIAVSACRKGATAPLTMDLAGTALLLCAVDGSEAALSALRFLRSRFASSVSANVAET